ncbi:MAG: FAD-binding oxidoreductase [Bacteroidetes bacterium]|nr:FAD-binding oxidoreductase [Bacteroidota bacterium]
MVSYWERESLIRWDYIVLGAGIVGLSTALELRAARPQARILVLERGLLPMGASSRNAGFACFGSLTEILDDLQHMRPEQVQALVTMRWEGLRHLRSRIGDARLGLEPCGGYELLAPHLDSALEHIDRINDLLRPIIGDTVFTLADDRRAAMGFDRKAYTHLVYNPHEAAIHTGKLVDCLLQLARQQDIALLTGAEVTAIHEETQGVRLETRQGHTFWARQLGVCTNAFTRTLFPQLQIEPGRGAVLVTKPIPGGVPFRGVFHMDEGYVYFRHLGPDRVLIGGGRNRFRAAETTTDFALNPDVMAYIRGLLQEAILPGISWEEDIAWAGIMAFGEVKAPILQRLSPRQSVGVRMGGMGVAIGSQVGIQLAGLMTAED